MAPPNVIPEKFDLNTVTVSGTVQRIWAQGPDILLRLRLLNPAAEPGATLTLLLPAGQLHGQPVTLLKGDPLTASGYLIEAPYHESGRQFLERSRQSDLLPLVPGLAEVVTERMATYVVITDLLPAAAAPTNQALIEGVVTRVWETGSHRFARLAIYDEHTPLLSTPGKHGRPRRQAHYVSVHFVAGQVAGREVRLHKPDRIRVSGSLSERKYSETLAGFLLRAGQIGLLAAVPNADDVRAVRTPRVATYLTAHALLQFTK